MATAVIATTEGDRSMIRFLAGSLLTLFACAAIAAERPNFSGEWKMDATKSDYGQVPMPDTFTRKIQHTATTISVTEEQTGPSATPTSVRSMTTDGQPSTQNINGGDVKLTATWEGTDLIATTAIDVLGLTFKDRMSLSADGKVLTSLVLVQSAQGDFELKIVFDRQ
jgi:hypothetical protein